MLTKVRLKVSPETVAFWCFQLCRSGLLNMLKTGYWFLLMLHFPLSYSGPTLCLMCFKRQRGIDLRHLMS